MPAENPFYKALVDQINFGTTPDQRRASEETLNKLFRPSVEAIIPPPKSTRGVTPEEYLLLWEEALSSLHTGVAVDRMFGAANRALDLSQAHVNAATNHMRRVTALVSDSAIDELGETPGRFQIKAASYLVNAVAELNNLAGENSPRIIQPDGGSLLRRSIWVLRHDPRAVDLFGPSRMREIFDITANLPKAQYTSR